MGSPKALLPFGNETMVERVVRLLGESVSPIVVVAAAGQELPPLPAAFITHDGHDNRGPLEGIRAGLSALPQGVDAAYATAVDVPFLVPAFVTRMVELLGEHDVAVMEVDGFTHPLSAVYRRRVLADATALLAAGRLRVADLFEVVKTRRVRAEEIAAVDPELATLRNINTPEDYRRALEQGVNRQ